MARFNGSEVSVVKACVDYFGGDRKITPAEFQALSKDDRNELRNMLIGEGYRIAPIA